MGGAAAVGVGGGFCPRGEQSHDTPNTYITLYDRRFSKLENNDRFLEKYGIIG